METESLAAALEREHREIDEGIAAFAAAPGDPQPLARAIRALRRHIYLEEEFPQLASRLLHHNLKEERVLYPRANDVLPPTAAGRLRAFLGSGELPEGWVCIKARPAAQDAGR